jgi:acyl-homoserine-lactone acylase
VNVTSLRRSLFIILFCVGVLSVPTPVAVHAVEDMGFARWEAMAKTVTIHRDKFGVPHVYGPTDAACVFGFVFAQAEDYFWQIEDNYLRGLGRASEVYGEAGLTDDLLNRALEIPRLSQEEYQRADPRIKSICQATADGLNYYLATHPQVKPRLIKHFEPWHPIAFGRYALYQLFIYRKSGLRPQQIMAAVQEIKDGKSVGMAVLRRSGAREEADEETLLSQHIGSNMWAVSAKKSTSGHAMLFINPHQPFFGPGQFYEGHLVSGEGWNLSGTCFFGTPFPTIGYNGHLAWSHTVNDPDIADAYAEKFDDPQQPLHYRHGDGHRRAEEWTDTVTVKTDTGVEARQYRFRKTHHGPVVAMDQGKPLTVRLARFQEGGMLEEWIAMGKAKSVAEFKAALLPCAVPMFNAMVADKDGNIFYVYNGAVPKRSTKFDWNKPVDGSNPETEWQGYHTFAELPQLENPSTGYLQNCNQTPFTTTTTKQEDPQAEDINPKRSQFPPYMVREQDNGRARISRRILHKADKFTYDAWAKAGFDTTVIEAETHIPPTVADWEKLKDTDQARYAKLREPVEMLKGWNHVSAADSVPMTLFAFSLEHGQRLLQRGDILNTPRLRALEMALTDLEKQYGTWKVAWGEVNRLQRIPGSQINMQGVGEFRDDLPSLPVAGAPGTVGIVFNFYARPQQGQKRRYGVAGHSYIGVVELGPKMQARTVLVFGQSGDPQSPHWFDQAPLYAKQEFKPSCFHEEEVKAASQKPYHPGESAANAK